jgi:hypothetical protein
MIDERSVSCPECDDLDQASPSLDRRDFIRVVGGGAAAVAVGGTALPVLARDKPAATTKPAEELVRELFASLSASQKKQVVHAWDHKPDGKGTPTRLRMYNRAIAQPIGKVYTRPQQELIDRILHAISAGEEGYRRLSRNGTFDGSGSLQGCGADVFGDPVEGGKFSWVFSGHHLTVRCDGNSEEGAAFGGPLYYGHSPDGYSDENVFYYQTRSVLSVFDALSEAQRRKAVVTGSPGEQEPSIRFRPKGEAHPGVALADLSADQRGLVETVLRDLLSPYRKEDADEVMNLVKAAGGLEKIHLAFYKDGRMNDQQRWHFWRLEGPGFVWNYRVLPHVHCYVNISGKV